MNNKMPRTPFSTPLSGSVKETEIRIRNIMSGPKKRPPVLFLALVFSVCIFCGNLVSCQVKETEGPDTGAGSSLADLPDPPEREPGMEVRESQVVLEDIDLDGDGLADTVTATTRFDPLGNGESDITLTAVLGRGETVERQWTEEENYLSIAVLMAGSVISPDRDALVLGLEVFGSNYGAAETYIFALTDGSLTECYRTENASTISGTYLTYCSKPEGSPLDSVRIPVLVDKWHAPEYYTLSWNGTGWDFVGDGYFTDAETVTVAGGQVLTLALRGRSTGEEFGPHLIYDQIQVFDGDMMFNPNMLLQTILPDDVPEDDRFLYEGFLADGSSWIWVQDVNFDGSEDFGIYCGSSYNGPMYWFLWNEEIGKYEPGFFSSVNLTVDTEKQQLVDTWKDGYAGRDSYTYQFNDQGERELVDHQRDDFPMPG